MSLLKKLAGLAVGAAALGAVAYVLQNREHHDDEYEHIWGPEDEVEPEADSAEPAADDASAEAEPAPAAAPEEPAAPAEEPKPEEPADAAKTPAAKTPDFDAPNVNPVELGHVEASRTARSTPPRSLTPLWPAIGRSRAARADTPNAQGASLFYGKGAPFCFLRYRVGGHAPPAAVGGGVPDAPRADMESAPTVFTAL